MYNFPNQTNEIISSNRKSHTLKIKRILKAVRYISIRHITALIPHPRTHELNLPVGHGHHLI